MYSIPDWNQRLSQQSFEYCNSWTFGFENIVRAVITYLLLCKCPKSLLTQVLNSMLSCLPPSRVRIVINIVEFWRSGHEGSTGAKGVRPIKLGLYFLSLQILFVASPYYFLWTFIKSHWSTINLNCFEFRARMENTLKREISCSFNIIKCEMFCSTWDKETPHTFSYFIIWREEIFRKTFSM